MSVRPVTGKRGRATTTRSRSPKRAHPRPPFPLQHQAKPGLDSKLHPAPEWRAPRYKSANKLEGKVALVTGGDSGIGRSVAYLYAREGADVAIACLPQERSDALETAAAIEALGRTCVIFTGDLSRTGQCERLVERTLQAFGKLDILVHNAAWQNRKKDVTKVSERELDRTMKVNVYAYIRLARSAVPHMKPGSCIIATGSIVGLHGSPELSDYSATKGAIHALTKTLASELIDKGIRVNCVAPGPVWTPLNASDQGTSARRVSKFGQESKEFRMGRPAQPEELAPAFVFLASEGDASFVTGAILPVTGRPV